MFANLLDNAKSFVRPVDIRLVVFVSMLAAFVIRCAPGATGV
jgi:hypothetical protein